MRSPGPFTGATTLLKASLHQDRRNIVPWVMLISVLSASSVLVYAWVFPDPADRAALTMALSANPALSLVFGPVGDLSTADGFNAWRAGQLGAFFAGLMAILVVIRTSRAEEDSGRAELIASGVLGRPARLAVSVLIAVIASVALGIVCSTLTVAVGGEVAASVTLAASFTASGLVFAGVGAVSAQIGADARTSSSLAIGVLGLFYVMRGYFDVSGADAWTAWVTPFGWLERTRAEGETNPWPLLLAVLASGVLVGTAFVLQSRRDFGQGLLAPRPGPARARLTANVWGLALALHRGPLVAWLATFAGLGAIFGTLVTAIGGLLADNPAMAVLLAAGGADAADFSFAFVVTVLQIVAVIAAVLGVQVVLRVYAEETDLHVELLLAGSLRRSTYLASNVAVALVATALAMLAAGTSLGLVASSRDDTITLGDVVAQAAATLPGVWVLVGLAVAAVGAFPGQRVIAWLGVVATFALTLLGPTFKLPEWALGLSPLHHVPNVRAVPVEWGGVVALCLVAATLTAAGFVGFRRRDLL